MAHVGSFSRVLAPSLRLAYLVAPRALRDDFVSAKLLCDLGCSAVEQAAPAHMLSSGTFARHLRSVVAAGSGIGLHPLGPQCHRRRPAGRAADRLRRPVGGRDHAGLPRRALDARREQARERPA